MTFGNGADAFRYLRRLIVEQAACGAWARRAFREDSKNSWLVDRGWNVTGVVTIAVFDVGGPVAFHHVTLAAGWGTETHCSGVTFRQTLLESVDETQMETRQIGGS